MSATIHPTAIIERGAQIDDEVVVDAYTYIGGMVHIGTGTHIKHHATVDGRTIVGENNVIHPYAYIGAPTHDLKYKGGSPGLKIGQGNVFREYCTMHVATAADSETVIGNNNVFLAYAHVGHDCIVGNKVIMSSQAALGGHVEIGDFANIGWSAGIHQFCKVGKYAMVGAAGKSTQNIPPFMLADGNPSRVRSPNFVNLKRNNFSDEKISQIKKIFKIFYLRGLNAEQAVAEIRAEDISSDIKEEFLRFLEDRARGVA